MITIYLAPYTISYPDKRHITEHDLGHCLLCRGLSDLFHIHFSAEELSAHLGQGVHKKPFLPEYPDVHFNISHCSGLVVCAFSNAPIGIDAENIRPFRDHLLRKVLTDSEKGFLMTTKNDPALYSEWFFRFWTLKESRIKQSGTGMSVALTDFSFQFDVDAQSGSEKSLLHPLCSEKDLYFSQFRHADTFIISVCSLLEESPVIISMPEY